MKSTLPINFKLLYQLLTVFDNDPSKLFTHDEWEDEKENLTEVWTGWDDEDPLPDFDEVKKMYNIWQEHDVKIIIADSNMSEHHLGGDDIVSNIDAVLDAIMEGYSIATDYDAGDVLVIGFRPKKKVA